MNIKQVLPCVLESEETGCLMHGQIFEVAEVEDLEGQNMIRESKRMQLAHFCNLRRAD